jgi:hypothetical protein
MRHGMLASGRLQGYKGGVGGLQGCECFSGSNR